MGKTQTAAEYCYRHVVDYDLVWWIRSEDLGSLASDYAGLAKELSLPEEDEKDQRITVKAVREALARRGRWVLIFDNARGPDDIKDYLPAGNSGYVLVTSRNAAFRGIAHALPVSAMGAGEALEFLLKRTPDTDKEGAGALAEALGGLPLALEHAGAYIEKSGSSFSGYLELFRTRQHDILGRAERPVGYDATVATTWEISFVEVEKESEAAGQLMSLCAFLAPDDIGREMLRDGAEELPEPLAAAVADDLQWGDAVAALRKYSLVEVQDRAISVHRLVQSVVRDRLDKAGRKKWAEAAVKVVGSTFPNDGGDVRRWAQCARLMPHALGSAERAETLQVGLQACARVLSHVGVYLNGRAELSTARSVQERALRIAEVVYGADDRQVAAIANNLGSVLEDEGDFAGARACYERALRIGEAGNGPDDPQVAAVLSNLGNVLKVQGDLEGARAYFERALKIQEAAYAPEHPDLAICVNNLGTVLRKQGDLAGARACYGRALRIVEAAYGPDHPQVATCVNNLGVVLMAEGDLARARANFKRALEIDEAVYGPDHPDVANRVWWLGVVFRDLGDAAQARAHFERAVGILERTLGRDHPHTQSARGFLEELG